MPLVPGERLGPYEITAPIGAGGMGEVYRARDPKLNRDVAIKVLPDIFARDPERLTRFTREAQTLAALNHPNVAQVFGVHEDALVMEFVDGEDLAQRIARGAMPIDDAIAVALQIACGLEVAHERGIVHRDLKPANVRMTPDGTVKILDFGLAKAMSAEGAGASSDVMNSPTFTSPPTAMGMIVGTAAYMAPEQARGKPVDKRADVWAFGCIVFEMLTGKRPFAGETVTDALAAIVKDEPSLSALPADTPPAVRTLISQCLVKDPKQRLRDIGDARIVLERPASASNEARLDSRHSGGARRFGAMHVAGAALAGALAAGLLWWRLGGAGPEPPRPLVGFVTPLAAEVAALRGNGNGVAFAPDGTWIVYAALPAGESAPMLVRRRMGALEPETLANTAGASAPFVSPDGQWIGFFTDGTVMKLAVSGGGASKICDRGPFSRAAWAANDTVVLGTSQAYSPGPLATVPAGGGTPAPLTALAGKETLHQHPHVLPDGRHVVFSVLSPHRVDLAVVALDGGAHQLLDLEGSGAVFVAPGHLLFAKGDAMFAVPFDPRQRRVTGSPVQVLDDAAVFAGGPELRIPLVGVDRSGSLAYVNKRTVTSFLAWMDSGGKATAITPPGNDIRLPRLSPDGRRIAFIAAQVFVPDVWVLDLQRNTRLRLTSGYALNPIWSPDGSRIAYADRDQGILSIAADGGGKAELLLARDPRQLVIPTSWSRSGGILFTVVDRGGSGGPRNRDIWVATPGGKPHPLLDSPADEQDGAISPNGAWLAYSSNASGRTEVYVRPFDRAGGTIPVSSDGGSTPIWAPDGTALHFLNGTKVMRAAVSGNPLQIGPPSTAVSVPPTVNALDVAADGRLLLAIRHNDAAAADALHVLLNWGRSLR